MKNLNNLSRILLFLAALYGIIWLGSYITRLFISYYLFESEGYILKDYINDQNMKGIFITLTPAFLVTLISYAAFIIFFYLMIITSHLNLKENGWLFIIFILVSVTLPFEVYLMSIDYEITASLLNEQFKTDYLLYLITERFKTLSGFPVIEIFCYFTIIFLALFRPLQLKPKMT
jgi:hypothetical protein